MGRLSATAVKAARTPGRYGDGGGLWLQVGKGSSKSWLFRYSFAGSDWHFNLDTEATQMSAGKWQLIATLSDGSQHVVWVQIK